MALPKKGSRPITVDNVKYRWRVIPTMFGPGAIVVSGTGRHSAVLRLTGAYFMRGQPLQNATPAHVEAIIRFGILKGWSSDGAKPMILTNDGQWDIEATDRTTSEPTITELEQFGFRVVSEDAR